MKRLGLPLAMTLSLAATSHAQTIGTIAFGSCARENRPQPVWHTIAEHDPDLFLFIGDNIYGDTEDMRVLRDKYDQLGAQPGFETLRRSCGVLATWDDHDFGENDAGKEYPKRAESQEAFLDFFGEPSDSERRATDGVYDAKIYGPTGKRVQIILLDTRFFRDPLVSTYVDDRKHYVPTSDTDTTILGETQWTWLEEQLLQPAELRIIATSIQIVSEEHRFEKWGNFPHERQRMFDLIDKTNANGVVFVSGDRHHLELSCDRNSGPYPMYDFTSSGLNQGRDAIDGGLFDEPNRHRLTSPRRAKNFGVIRIDWDERVPTITFEGRSPQDDVYLRYTLRLDELR